MNPLRLIYGGTFDPIHSGHLAVARAAREAVGAERVILLPCGDPPHRARPGASGEHRAAMLQIAIADDPLFVIDTRELSRVGLSYTIDTLRELRQELGPLTPMVLLLGRDAADGLASWHQVAEMPALTHLLIMARPGYPGMHPERALGWQVATTTDALAGSPAGLVLEMPRPVSTASSTAVRGGCDEAWQDLPPGVADYMRAHRLYR
ncbi:nicotinate-nucleotide adenylyltransferase [Pseudomarimonas arenosa]|uniref:Probable nicotinate-nucleotide adenylyltransferase n=1 Tax=Pseudomarimonas arenosa TaxID=2774145 RepID=A0AAW3ZMM9_9GAMM|nr:nicotinate-nucleotide adenylyltransferase [Pseudomarimonas arenosa]MBD8526988.1 nicotinate-nucleotide adenylyltransferase [Pseudomarimonas arenosa]